MPITNLNNTHLTAAQITAINNALNALETALASINTQLTPEERKQYGSINEQNKLLVNKVKDYNDTQPALSDPSISWAEFNADHTSRLYKENVIYRLDALINRLKNSKTLHDYDNFQTALAEYAHTSFMAGKGNPGFETKYNELKQFFNRTGATQEENENEQEQTGEG